MRGCGARSSHNGKDLALDALAGGKAVRLRFRLRIGGLVLTSLLAFLLIRIRLCAQKETSCFLNTMLDMN